MDMKIAYRIMEKLKKTGVELPPGKEDALLTDLYEAILEITAYLSDNQEVYPTDDQLEGICKVAAIAGWTKHSFQVFLMQNPDFKPLFQRIRSEIEQQGDIPVDVEEIADRFGKQMLIDMGFLAPEKKPEAN